MTNKDNFDNFVNMESSLIDGSELTTTYEKAFDNESAAKNVEHAIISKVQAIESDKANITSEIINENNQFVLKMAIEFSCQAEMMIFEMQKRSFD